MPNRLSNIEINEVSFVDKPADPNAKVSFFKREDDVDEITLTNEEIEKKIKLAGGAGPREFSIEMREALAARGKALGDGSFPIPDKDALRRAVLSFGRAGPGKQAQVRAHIIRRAKALGATEMLPAEWQLKKEETAMAKKGFLHGLASRLGLNVEEDTSLDDLDTALGLMTDTAYEDVAKAIVAEGTSDSYDDDDSGPTGGKMSKTTEELLGEAPDELVEYVKRLETERDDAIAKAEESDEEVVEDDDTDEDVLKGANPKIVEMLRKAQNEADEANKIAKAERDARERREFITKAETLPYIGEERTDVGELLKSISDLVPESTFSALDAVLKAANAQIAESKLFDEAGMPGQGTTGDAYQQLEGIAKRYVSENTELTSEQAFAKALDEHPELYDRYMSEGV